MLYTPTTTTAQFRYAGDAAATGGYIFTNGIWYHILATGQSGSQLLYVNGAIQPSLSNTNSTTPSPNSNNLVIGKLAYAGLYLSGRITTCRIYNKVLSAQEVLQNYNAQKSRFNL
jgi:hypothetical protein